MNIFQWTVAVAIAVGLLFAIEAMSKSFYKEIKEVHKRNDDNPHRPKILKWILPRSQPIVVKIDNEKASWRRQQFFDWLNKEIGSALRHQRPISKFTVLSDFAASQKTQFWQTHINSTNQDLESRLMQIAKRHNS